MYWNYGLKQVGIAFIISKQVYYFRSPALQKWSSKMLIEEL